MMAKLSEEEIIKDIVEIVELAKKEIENNDENITATLDLQDLKSLKGLLDLYKKEKEKREIAEENHKVLSLDLGKALKELGLYEDIIIADELVLEINKRFVSKDKIKAKIEEYNKQRQKAETQKINDMFVDYIDVLQELLKENKK